MNTITQTQIAKQAKVSQPSLANIIAGRRRPSWKAAKRLAFATNTTPYLWLEGTPDEIKAELERTYELMKPVERRKLIERRKPAERRRPEQRFYE